MIGFETYPNVDQAAAALRDDGVYFGGGTLIMRALNYGEQDFSRIVRTTDPALKQVEAAGDRVRIGADVTMREVIASSDLSFLTPVARSVGGPAVRNVATVGGNLFAEHPYGDFTVALLALDGRVSVAGGGEHDLSDFISSRTTFNGVVTSVSVARPGGQDFRYHKVSRVKPKGVSVMSIAAWLPRATGRISNARLAFGAMGETPLRALPVEQALEGTSLDASGIESALQAVIGAFNPPDDPLASGWYRKEVAPVHLRRLLLGEGEK